MAHYARLGVNNVVVQIDIVDNSIITNSGGLERDGLAFEHLAGQFGAGMWVKCSYNTVAGVHGLGGTPLRANYPGGAYDEDDPWYYDGTNELYDHKNDPHEWINLSGNKKYVKIIEELKQHIPKKEKPQLISHNNMASDLIIR